MASFNAGRHKSVSLINKGIFNCVKNKMRISMVTGLSSIGKVISFRNAGGMGTQVPILAEKLEEKGFDVAIDDVKDFDVLHLHNPLPNFVPLVRRAKRQGKPVVIHARHIPELVKGGFKFDKILYPVFDLYSRWLYNQADVVICATPYVKRWMEQNGVKSKLAVIPNGVDISRFCQDDERRAEFRKNHALEGKFLIFSVGLLIPRKGVRDFINVAKKFEGKDAYHFLWVGSTEPGLEKADISDAPGNINFIGHIPFDEMPAVYSAGDVFFFPTYAESYGNVLFEAAASGKPIVLRDIEIYEDWLKNGVNCLKGKTAEEYAAHIKTLFENKKMRESLGKEAKRLAEEHNIDNTVSKLAELYESLIE